MPTLIATYVVLIAFAGSVGMAQNPPLDARVKALNAIFSDYWEDLLKHQPDFASSIGDNRYNGPAPRLLRTGIQRIPGARSSLSRPADRGGCGWDDRSAAVEQRFASPNINRESQEARFSHGSCRSTSSMACRPAFPSSCSTELQLGQGLRRLHRSPQKSPARLSTDHGQYVHRYGRPSRATRVPDAKSADAG